MENKRIGRIRSFVYLLKRLKKYYVKMVVGLVGGIIRELSVIGAAGIAAYLVATAWIESMEQPVWLLGVLTACVVLSGVMYYVEMWCTHDVAYHIIVDFRLSLYHAFEKICPEVLLKNRSGQLAVTLMNDVELTETFFGHTIGAAVVAVIVDIVMIIFMGFLHPILAVVMALCSLLIPLVPFMFRKQADVQGEENRYVLGEANSVTLEGINGMKEILTLKARDRYKKKNAQFMQKLTDNQVSYARRQGKEGSMIQLAVGIAAMAPTMVSFYLYRTGSLEAQWLVVMIVISWLMYNPLVEVSSIARTLGMIFAACERMFNVLESQPLVEDKGEDMDINQLSPEVVFDHVSFRYDDSLPNAVQDISFRVKPGETVALVGESGAGKTTCINLLMRLWDVTQGKISIGGVDIRDMSVDNIHTITSAVLQDVYLFNTSIRENIRLGNVEASDQEVEDASRQALAHEFIQDMAEGYDTITGERGVSLSGGQRQRLAIARALLKKSPILIFDEAVSNLDTMSEREIQKTLKTISQGKTVLMVAHRLSTIKMADWLIVLKNGQIAEIGTHEELLAKDSYYKKLVASQVSVKA